MEQRNNNGVLFKNDRKEEDRHPDYKGKAMVDGKNYELAAWVKTSKSGNKFMSLSFKPSEKQDNDQGG
jgi:uncharacterized protein (DUF736 family)